MCKIPLITYYIIPYLFVEFKVLSGPLMSAKSIIYVFKHLGDKISCQNNCTRVCEKNTDKEKLHNNFVTIFQDSN